MTLDKGSVLILILEYSYEYDKLYKINVKSCHEMSSVPIIKLTINLDILLYENLLTNSITDMNNTEDHCQ